MTTWGSGSTAMTYHIWGDDINLYTSYYEIGMVTSNNNQQESRFLGFKHMGISTNNNENWVDTPSLVTTILELMGPIIKH